MRSLPTIGLPGRGRRSLDRSAGEIPAGFDAAFSLREFAKDLAFQMFLHDTTSVLASGGSYRMRDRSAEIWSRFFNPRDPTLTLSLQGIPHRKDGDRISFIHKSILEYLVAVVFLDELSLLGDEKLSKEAFLNQKHIQAEPAVVRFLAEMLKGKAHLQEILWETIERSKARDDITMASANAITMLDALDLPMHQKDFRGIKIKGADLSFSRMANTDFTGADLREVNLSRSSVPGCTFDGAMMEGVYFGEMPRLLGHTERVNSVCMSSDGKKIISGSGDATIRIWDAESGAELKILEGHSNSVVKVEINQKGEVIRSEDASGEILFWAVESGTPLQNISSLEDEFVTLSSSGDKKISWHGKVISIHPRQSQFPLVISSSRPLDLTSCSLSGVSGLSKSNQKLFEQFNARLISIDISSETRQPVLPSSLDGQISEISEIKESISGIKAEILEMKQGIANMESGLSLTLSNILSLLQRQ